MAEGIGFSPGLEADATLAKTSGRFLFRAFPQGPVRFYTTERSMFGLGPLEIVVIGAIAVMLYGKRLPEVGLGHIHAVL